MAAAFAVPAPMANPRISLGRAGLTTGAGFAVAQVLRLASTVILSRLLVPQAFGLMAIVSAVIAALSMFSDTGSGLAVVRSHRADADWLNTAWTLQVVRGVALALCAAVLAVPLSMAYAQPALLWMIPMVAAGEAIIAFSSISQHTASRDLLVGRVVALELGSAAVGLLVAAIGAVTLGGPAALVAGSLATAISRLILSHTLLPAWPHRWCWNRDASRELLHFGRWIFVSTATTFAASQADRLIVGGTLGLARLGVYQVAVLICLAPVQLVQQMGNRIFYPLYSRVLRESRSLPAAFERSHRCMSAAGTLCTITLLVLGPALIAVMYDPRYAAAGWMLRILAVGTWLRVLECSRGCALLALNEPRWVAAGNAAKVAGMLVALPLGWHLAGAAGLLAGLVAAEAIKTAVSLLAARRHGLRGTAVDVLGLVLVALVVTAIYMRN